MLQASSLGKTLGAGTDVDIVCRYVRRVGWGLIIDKLTYPATTVELAPTGGHRYVGRNGEPVVAGMGEHGRANDARSSCNEKRHRAPASDVPRARRDSPVP